MLQKPQLLIGFTDYQPPAQRLADVLQIPFAIAEIHRFPDGESKLTLPTELPSHIAFCRSLNHPNSKLIELLLAAQTARQIGVQEITLVAPYLCYMRQDIAFNAGEAVSQKIIGRFMAEQFDAVLTVDAHLHRVHTLSQAVPAKHAVNLSAAELVGEHVKTVFKNPLLIGPDEESLQWVQTAAKPGDFEYAVGLKTRMGDASVKVRLPERSFEGRDIVIVDDMVSTGQTIIETAKLLREKNAKTVYCVTTHALFDQTATEHMRQAGIETVWSTDSVPHPTNHIPLARLLAGAFTR